MDNSMIQWLKLFQTTFGAYGTFVYCNCAPFFFWALSIHLGIWYALCEVHRGVIWCARCERDQWSQINWIDSLNQIWHLKLRFFFILIYSDERRKKTAPKNGTKWNEAELLIAKWIIIRCLILPIRIAERNNIRWFHNFLFFIFIPENWFIFICNWERMATQYNV